MESFDEEIESKNTLYTDFRAEFVAACLIENGYNAEEIRIIREGMSKGGKNIDKIVWEKSLDKFTKYLTLYSRKRNLYESLPEGIFHRRMDIDDKKNKETVIDYFKQERQKALSASYFFRPFEISIDRFLVDANLYEMRLDKPEKHDDFIRMFDSLLPISQKLPLEKSLFAVSLFSQVYRLTKPEHIAEILSVFLNCEVKLTLEYQQMTLRADKCDWQLGENRLNVSTVLGGEISDCFPVMNVRIDSLPPQYKDLLFEKSAAYRQFMEIMDLFVPADTEIKISINVANDGLEFLLSDNESAPLLGYSTILS